MKYLKDLIVRIAVAEVIFREIAGRNPAGILTGSSGVIILRTIKKITREVLGRKYLLSSSPNYCGKALQKLSLDEF